MLGNVYNYMGFRSFCFEQFCLDRSVANLMMLTINVCLMHDCFLVEKFYLHYALCDFDSILLHCTKLFSRQSIDREQIFDVTFEPPPRLKNLAYATGPHLLRISSYSTSAFIEFVTRNLVQSIVLYCQWSAVSRKTSVK